VQLHAICYYRSKSDEWTEKWRDADFTARNLVQAVKRNPFNGFSSLTTLAGKVFRIENTPSGQNVAMGYASQKLAQLIGEAGYEDVAVIPIPSSSHVKPGAEFTGSRLAAAIQERNPNFKARPVLYFNRPVPKSSGGGGRDARLIEAHLRATSEIQGISRAVLLDDVFTTGAHMRAVVRFLSKYDIEIEDGFVVGRTAWEKPASMFKCAREEVYIEGGNLSLFNLR
jgi:hypothetical protein